MSHTINELTLTLKQKRQHGKDLFQETCPDYTDPVKALTRSLREEKDTVVEVLNLKQLGQHERHFLLQYTTEIAYLNPFVWQLMSDHTDSKIMSICVCLLLRW